MAVPDAIWEVGCVLPAPYPGSSGEEHTSTKTHFVCRRFGAVKTVNAKREPGSAYTTRSAGGGGRVTIF
jgi:hypothetical protein